MSGLAYSFPVSCPAGEEAESRFVLPEGYEISGWDLEKDEDAKKSGSNLQYSIVTYSGNAEMDAKQKKAVAGALGGGAEVKGVNVFKLDVNGSLSQEAKESLKTSHQHYTVILKVKSAGPLGRRGEGCVTLKVKLHKKEPAKGVVREEEQEVTSVSKAEKPKRGVVKQSPVASKLELSETSGVLAHPLTIEQKEEALFKAIRSDNVGDVKSLLSDKPSLVSAVDQKEKNVTPLHVAASRKGSSASTILGELLDKGASVNATQDNMTALYEATKAGNEAGVKLLLDKKADPHKPTKEGYTPLHKAAEKDQGTIVKHLVEHKGLDRLAKNGKSPLHLAIENQHFDPVKFLIESKADINLCVGGEGTDKGKRPLELAQKGGHPGIIGLLEGEKARIEQEEAEAKDLPKFLQHIANGEQDEAENMLRKRPSLALRKGGLKDPSGREFKEITGFQYALWALDWHMWKMLMKYMDPKDAAEQLAELEEKGTVHGKQFSLKPLIDALNGYVTEHPRRTTAESSAHWCKVVGKQQLLLPVHVVNEYCHPSRPFDPCPMFDEEELKRSKKVDEGEWYTCIWHGGRLGEKFAILRDDCSIAKTRDFADSVLYMWDRRPTWVKSDHAAIQSLWRARKMQLEELKSALSRHLTSSKK